MYRRTPLTGSTVSVYAMITRREPFFGIREDLELAAAPLPLEERRIVPRARDPDDLLARLRRLRGGVLDRAAPDGGGLGLVDELAVHELVTDLEREPLDLRAGRQREPVDALRARRPCRSRTSRRSRCARRCRRCGPSPRARRGGRHGPSRPSCPGSARGARRGRSRARRGPRCGWR